MTINLPQPRRHQPQRDELVIVDNGQPRIPGNLYVPHDDLNAEPFREPERPRDITIERSAPIPIPRPRRREQGAYSRIRQGAPERPAYDYDADQATAGAGYMTETEEEMLRLYGGTFAKVL